MLQQLSKLVGCTVSVYTGKAKRNSFDTAVSVCGTLEQGSPDMFFRVLVSEGTYCYFTTDDVLQVISNPARFRDGSVAVIRIMVML